MAVIPGPVPKTLALLAGQAHPESSVFLCVITEIFFFKILFQFLYYVCAYLISHSREGGNPVVK